MSRKRPRDREPPNLITFLHDDRRYGINEAGKGAVKTFIIDAPVMLAFGFAFSWFYERAEGKGLFASRAFIHGMIFASTFNLSVVFSYLVAPDWMWMYYPFSSETSVPGLVYIFIFLYYVPFILGYMLGARWRERRPWAWIPGLAASLVMEAIIVGVLFDRYFHVGTTAEYHVDPAAMMTLADFPGYNRLGVIMNTFFAALFVYFVFLVWIFKLRKKKQA